MVFESLLSDMGGSSELPKEKSCAKLGINVNLAITSNPLPVLYSNCLSHCERTSPGYSWSALIPLRGVKSGFKTQWWPESRALKIRSEPWKDSLGSLHKPRKPVGCWNSEGVYRAIPCVKETGVKVADREMWQLCWTTPGSLST